MSAAEFTLGVEEEYQIVDPQTRELAGRAEPIISSAKVELGDAVQPEIHRSQIETVTSVCSTLQDVRAQVSQSRRSVIEAAAKDQKAIAAAGTHPFSSWQQQTITPKERYQGLEQHYQQVIRELVIFGSHVHVGIADREMAVAVVNRARIWLGVLLALTGNSPFWLGNDTGYTSYRTELWYRIPLAGPPPLLKNHDDYRHLVKALVSSEVIEDATKIYWDARLSEKFPTVEFRVADVCLTVDDAVMYAGLVRGLARTCYEEATNDVAFEPVSSQLLRAAHWQAARYGLRGKLIDVVQASPVAAQELVQTFLSYIRPALEEFGDWEEVSSLVEKTLRDGNGGERQYQVYQRQGSYKDVVDYLVEQTKQ